MDGMKGGKHNSDDSESKFERKSKRITRENVADHLFDYQLEMIGKTRIDILDNDRWRFDFTMTQEQLVDFTSYAIPLLQKTFRYNRRKALDTFEWFRMQFGIRIKN